MPCITDSYLENKQTVWTPSSSHSHAGFYETKVMSASDPKSSFADKGAARNAFSLFHIMTWFLLFFRANKIHRVNYWFMFFQESIFME